MLAVNTADNEVDCRRTSYREVSQGSQVGIHSEHYQSCNNSIKAGGSSQQDRSASRVT